MFDTKTLHGKIVCILGFTIAFFLLLFIAATYKSGSDELKPYDEGKPLYEKVKVADGVYRFYDKETGADCYQSIRGISCVKQ